MNEEFKILRVIELSFGVAELRSDEILTFVPNDNFESYTVDVLKDMLATFLQITNNTPHLYFCDNSNIKNPQVSSEAKAYMNDHFHKFALACAMTEDSAITRFAAHTFMYLYKPKIPIKLFKTKNEAISWLKSLDIK